MAPMRCLAIDSLGPVISGGGDDKYAMSVIDMFSYWFGVTLLKTNAAQEVAEALHLHVSCDIAGWPVVLRSDRGEFTAEVFRELNDRLGIRQVSGSAYHARGQPLIERTHRGLNDALKAYVVVDPKSWARVLPLFRWSWNSTPKQALGGFSPYSVLTGLEPRNPVGTVFGDIRNEAITHSEYVTELPDMQKSIYALVKSAQEHRGEANLKRAEA